MVAAVVVDWNPCEHSVYGEVPACSRDDAASIASGPGECRL